MTTTANSDLCGHTASGSEPPKLEVQSLHKRFETQGNPFLALEDISLKVYPNEFVSIVGSSGCGKSTLLNIIAGLTPPSSGQVLMDGEPIEGPGPDRGMICQSYTLFPWLSVADNIGFGLELRKVPKAERRDRIGHYLAVVGLSQFAQSYPKQLSGGMRQRVAIARALANDPEVLLMDEPFGALDAQTREQMQQFMLNLWERTHITILMITHDVEEAVFLSQRIYVMVPCPGRIKEEILVGLPPQDEVETRLKSEFMQMKRRVIHALHH